MTVEAVSRFYRRRTGRELNLDAPRGMSEIVQWLKVNDRRPEHVICCDKIAVRGWVAAIVGADVLVPRMNWPPTKFPCVAKCSHDSGSSISLNGPDDIPEAQAWLKSRLARSYGVEKCEWAYAQIEPAILVERALPDPLDVKAHCAGGEVKFVQAVRGGITDTRREAIFLPDGTVTGMRTNQKIAHDPTIDPGDGWGALMAMARRLSAGWRYVRVDLMWSAGRPWFGEMTFWPVSGIFYEADELALGDLLGGEWR